MDKELYNYDYLLGADIDHRRPEVRADLLAWGSWILESTGASGFRLDAIKHMDRRFLLEFIKNCRATSGQSRMFAVAEYWSPDLKPMLPYIRAFQGQTAFFDVPLHYNLHLASKLGPRYDLRQILNGTIVKGRPDCAVTFVDNHDTQVGQTLESWVDTNFKLQAYALILLRSSGHPCVFYGDLYPNEECYHKEIARGLKLLIEARKNHAYGKMKNYFTDKTCVGFVRLGTPQHPGCATVITHQSSGVKFSQKHMYMHVGFAHGGSTYRALLSRSSANVEISEDGWGRFPSSPQGVEVWVKVRE